MVEHSPCHPSVKGSSSAAATDRENDKEVVQITLGLYREYYRGKYHCSIDLLFDWFVSCHTANSKPVKQEVNRTVILPPLVFPGSSIAVKRGLRLHK